MSVHALPRRVPVDPLKIEDTIKLLGAMVRAYDNAETLDENAAIEAASQGRPAYWTAHKYHHQLARILVGEANRDGLKPALQKWCISRHPDSNRSALALLDTLVPLNAVAILELTECRKAAALDLMSLAHSSGRLHAAE